MRYLDIHDSCNIQVPRQFIHQSSRDKHDFNIRYITAVTKRIRWYKKHCVLPKPIGKINNHRFWIDIDYRTY